MTFDATAEGVIEASAGGFSSRVAPRVRLPWS